MKRHSNLGVLMVLVGEYRASLDMSALQKSKGRKGNRISVTVTQFLLLPSAPVNSNQHVVRVFYARH